AERTLSSIDEHSVKRKRVAQRVVYDGREGSARSSSSATNSSPTTAVARSSAALTLRSTRPTAASTVEALMYALRVGIEKLNPDRLRRLSELNEQQLHAVCERLRNFKPNIAPAWLADQIEALVTIWSELNERRREHERNR